MQLSEILSKEIFSANPSSKVSEVAQIMLRHNIGAVPICDKDNKLLGIITDRDLAIECCTSQVDVRNAEVREFMTQNPVTARPDMDAKAACEMMAHEQVHRLPVVDNGRIVGIISLGDLAVCLPHEQAVLDALARISIPCRVSEQAAVKEQAAGM